MRHLSQQSLATGVFEAMLEALAEPVERDRSDDMIDSTIVRHKKGTQATQALG